MTTDARAERAALCDLLIHLGPDQPTLCEGWRTRDLAAHLVLRERRPLAAPGIMLSPLAGYTARVQGRLAQRPFADLVRTLRRPPAWSPTRLAPLDQAVNGTEMFVHHEDVRRAQPDWQPRELSTDQAGALWRRVRTLGRFVLRRVPAMIELAAPGYGSVTVGRGGPSVRLYGDPGELTMFLTGRQQAARVEVTGPSALTDQLVSARLGL